MGKSIQVYGFPPNITALEVKTFLEKYTGSGTVFAVKIRLTKAKAYALVQFTKTADAERITSLASQGLWCPSSQLEVFAAPRIYERVCSPRYVPDDPSLNYYMDVPDYQWVRTTDFTQLYSIGQSYTLCLELPHNVQLPNFEEYFDCYKENDAFPYSCHPTLVPSPGCLLREKGFTAADIRSSLGDFSEIRNVAKYAVRLGQSFSSSTETLSVNKDEINLIPDIEIVNDGIKHSMKKYESENTELDVLNWSKYQPCFLNRQLITLLSTLGVPDHAFEMKVVEQVVVSLDDLGTGPLEAMELMSMGEITDILKEMLLCGYKPDEEPFLSVEKLE
ncbi:hypothetical protein V6N13_040629 [Hibiscus sabdariffa]